MENYKIPDNPKYSPNIRKLQDSDPVSASTVVNPLIMRLVENTAAVRQEAMKTEIMAEGRLGSLEKAINGMPKLSGERDPTPNVQAQVGQIYINAATGMEWECIAVNDGETDWRKKEGSSVKLDAESVGAIDKEAIGKAGGVASLNASGKVPVEQLPSLKPYEAGTDAPEDKTKLWIDTAAETGGLKYWNGTAWVHVPVAYT